MFKIKQYSIEKECEWNDFVSNSKNGTFLFDRRYMDYHADRFEDLSLMVYRKKSLYTLLPANRAKDVLYSHQGLTYGGYIMQKNATATGMIEAVQHVNSYLRSEGISKIIYKSIPFIYHKYPSQEDSYALFKCCHCKMIGCHIASTIFLQHQLKYDKSRKYGISKALRLGLKIMESTDFAAFWEILQNNLKNKYDTQPVHTLDEIALLHNRFPENIKLYLVYKDKTVLGGSILYISQQVVHAQYAVASPEGKESGALDLLFDYFINEKYIHYPYFDFGHSNEQMGAYLNENLIFQKEGFGARGMVYNTYEITL